jgi:hypothetical protein
MNGKESANIITTHRSEILVHNLAGALKIGKSAKGLSLFSPPYKQRTCVLNTVMYLK